VTKYSTAPPSKKTQDEIEKEATDDLQDYLSKVKKRICALKHLEKRNKILDKVIEELPSAHDLFHIKMSYRIYQTEDRIRIRRPSDLVISIAKTQENNNKNV
jgi:predicted DNA binding CopG/RHH family protein